jgi:hypothetical protein
MVEVLESYFSDEGLKRNQFLAKQIQLNPEGIPLKKVAAMRRVKVRIKLFTIFFFSNFLKNLQDAYP